MIPVMDALYNKLHLQSFAVNSLPKSGTNLLIRILSVFPGVSFIDMNEQLRANVFPNKPRGGDALSDQTIVIGVDRQIYIAGETLQKLFGRLRRGAFTSLHFSYSDPMHHLLSRARMKMVLLLRDPRDVVLSHSDYVYKNKNHSLYPFYQSMSPHDRITTSIVGLKSARPEGERLLSIKKRYTNLSRWGTDMGYCTVFFENLVGEPGGGTMASQSGEIARLADYLGIHFAADSLMRKIRGVYGSGPTFSKGRIGRWQSGFSNHHKKVFKEIAGQLLIDFGYESDMGW